jgi:hypothetical protein
MLVHAEQFANYRGPQNLGSSFHTNQWEWLLGASEEALERLPQIPLALVLGHHESWGKEPASIEEANEELGESNDDY